VERDTDPVDGRKRRAAALTVCGDRISCVQACDTGGVRGLRIRVIGLRGLGPPSEASIGRLSGVDALWDCVPRVCGGGGGCAGGGVPVGAVPALSWWGGVSRGVTNHHQG